MAGRNTSSTAGRAAAGPRLSAAQVWAVVRRGSFAVLGHVTPTGEPRSSGVLYAVDGHRMYVAVARDSWKARHIGAHGTVAVTVPVRRGGPLSLVFPIPPATVSFTGAATLHPGRRAADVPVLDRLVPAARRDACTVVEIEPVGHFVTYGIGVSLARMRDPGRSCARVAI